MDNQIFNGMNKTRVAFAIFLGLFVTVVVIILLSKDQQKNTGELKKINSFEECAKAGNPVMESYPRQCRLKNGELFIERVITQECVNIKDCPANMACINHVCQKISN